MRWSPRSTCDRATSWCWVRAPSRKTPSGKLRRAHSVSLGELIGHSFASIAPWAVTRRELIGTWHSALVSRPFQPPIRAQTSTYTASASLEKQVAAMHGGGQLPPDRQFHTATGLRPELTVW